jgi:hypothetical protein
VPQSDHQKQALWVTGATHVSSAAGNAERQKQEMLSKNQALRLTLSLNVFCVFLLQF